MPDPVPEPLLDLVSARRWAMTARLVLGAARERIDALNVFPVPDGDTGTNMFLTMDGALEHVRVQLELGRTEHLRDGLMLIARGMLLAARGNSGVILAQLTRGLADAVAPGVEAAGPAEVAQAFEASARTAWGAVADPVEGTILTVARAAAAGARAAVEAGADDVTAVVDAAHDAAQEALAKTPDQLPELRAAGVVDAGGAGLVLVIEALQTVLREDRPAADGDLPDWWSTDPEPLPADRRSLQAGAAHGSGADGHDAVEVMFLLTGSDPERADRLRAQLRRLGDSVAVAGGPEDYQVHVHLVDPAAAVEAGSLAGTVSEVRHSALAAVERVGHGYAGGDHGHTGAAGARTVPGVGVVACALGEGITEVLREAGALVVPSGPRHRASAGALLSALRACGRSDVVILPNDGDTVMVARAAAAEAAREGLAVEVVPTRTLLEGVAALAVFDPAGTLGEVCASMRSSAQGVSGGAVTRADRAVATPVGPCRPGQWLGIVDHAIVAVDDDFPPAVSAMLDAIWHPGAELVTVLLGEDATDEVAAPLAELLDAKVVASGADAEISVVRGGQPTYPVLVGVE